MEYRSDRKVTDMTDFIMKSGYKLKELGNWAGRSVLKNDVRHINQLSGVTERSMEIYNVCKKNKNACQNLRECLPNILFVFYKVTSCVNASHP